MNQEQILEPLLAHFYTQNHPSPSFNQQNSDPSQLLHVVIQQTTSQDINTTGGGKNEMKLQAKKKISKINKLSDKARKNQYLQKLKERFLYHNLNWFEKIIHNQTLPIIKRKYILALQNEIDQQEAVNEFSDLNAGLEKMDFNQKIIDEEDKQEQEIISNIDGLQI